MNDQPTFTPEERKKIKISQQTRYAYRAQPLSFATCACSKRYHRQQGISHSTFALFPFTVLGRAPTYTRAPQQPKAIETVRPSSSNSSSANGMHKKSRRFLRSVDYEPWLHVVVACRSLSSRYALKLTPLSLLTVPSRTVGSQGVCARMAS